MTVAAAILAGAALAGCSGSSLGDTPPTTPPPVTISPTPGASSTAPPMPPEAQAATQAGAEAFIRWFWDVYNATYASGDTSTMQQAAAVSCQWCAAVVRDVRDLSVAGTEHTGGVVTVDSVAVAPGDLSVAALANLVLDETAYTQTRDGTLIKSYPAAVSFPADVVLSRESDEWRVAAVEIKK